MQSMGIKELQTNPAILTRALEAKEYTMITKRSNPIGIVVSLDDTIISDGLKTSLLITSFKNGNLSLGQLSKALNVSKQKAMKLLSMMSIDVIDYKFSDDLDTLDKFL
jgi:predicted HTH domain antitoxin